MPSLATSLLWVELPDEAGSDPMPADHPPPSWASDCDVSDWVKAIVVPGATPPAGAAKDAWQFITASEPDWPEAFAAANKTARKAHCEALAGLGMKVRLAHTGKRKGETKGSQTDGTTQRWLAGARELVLQATRTLTQCYRPAEDLCVVTNAVEAEWELSLIHI